MTEKNQIYKCEHCGITVSLIHAGGGALVCCGTEMELLEEKTAAQEGKEKHVPVIEVEGNTVTVKVGSVAHPMEESHYIQLIQLMQDGKVIMGKTLSPNDEPKAVFCGLENTENLSAREICNIHGLWRS